jgi:hypothetical protein
MPMCSPRFGSIAPRESPAAVGIQFARAKSCWDKALMAAKPRALAAGSSPANPRASTTASIPANAPASGYARSGDAATSIGT